DQLEQVQVARRVEEVRAQPVLPETVGPPFGNRGDRDPRGVGADDGVGAADGFDAFHQRALGVELLDHRFDDPVGVAGGGQVLVEAARGDERDGVRREEGIGLEPLGALEPLARGLARHVEQAHAQPSVGEMRGDLRTHHAGAQHGGGVESHLVPRRRLSAALSTDLSTKALAEAEALAEVDAFAEAEIPPTKMSTIASASPASAYLRRLRIQLVAISSRPPKNSFDTSVAFSSLRKMPEACPAAMMPRMMPRYSRSSVDEKRSMNLVDCRSSTWKTTARLRSRPMRSRWTRGISRSCAIGSVSGATQARPSAIAARIVRSKIETRRSSLPRKYR